MLLALLAVLALALCTVGSFGYRRAVMSSVICRAKVNGKVHMQVNDYMLAPESTELREAIEASTNDLYKRGVVIFDEYGVRLLAAESWFILEVPTRADDDDDQVNTVICRGVVTVSPTFKFDVARSLNVFIGNVGRSISVNRYIQVIRALDTWPKSRAFERHD